MIAVLFALPDESQDFCRLLESADRRGRGVELVVNGRLGPHEVQVAHTGIGAEPARRRAREVIERDRPSLMISSGYAGGLQPELSVGEVVIDLRGNEASLSFTVTGRERLGRMATVVEAAETPAAKAALGQSTGALAVEMETGIIAEVCREKGVLLVGIRSISDSVTQALPVPLEHCFSMEKQEPRVFGLLGYLLLHPQKIAPFARFVSGLSPARAALAETLSRFIQAVPQ